MTDEKQKSLDDARDKQIDDIRVLIKSIEYDLSEAKNALAALSGDESPTKSAKPQKIDQVSGKATEGGKVIEGIFDGESMLGPDGQIYPIPANYVSKSKLVEGDRLKLTIAADGTFVFKQIGPVDRKKLIGTLNYENNVYTVSAEGKNYNVIYASVTYFKAKAGDRVTIVVPRDEDSKWAAIENIIRDENGESNETVVEPPTQAPDQTKPPTAEVAPTDSPRKLDDALPEFPEFDEPPRPQDIDGPSVAMPDETGHVVANVPASPAPGQATPTDELVI